MKFDNIPVPMLHKKDHVRPIDQLLVYFDPGFGAYSGRTCVMQGMIFEYQLSGWAAPLIFAANEEEVGQVECDYLLTSGSS